MSPSQPAAASHTLTTNGWDTVYALYFADLNKAIAAQKTSPVTISGTSTGDDGTYVLAGTFGDWELTAGGDGENVYLRVPLTTSTLTLTNEGAAPTETKFDLVALTIEVQLQWVAASASGQEDLTVRAASAATGQPAVSIVGVDYGTATPTLVEKGVYEALAEAWLVANVGAFRQVFSTVVLNTTLEDDSASFQWTVPTATMYAVVDQPAASGQPGAARSVFAVLGMTEGRPSPGVHEVDPGVIPAGDGTKTINSAFLISGERFLNKLLLPGLPLMFKGTPALTSFSVAADGLSVTNTEDLQLTDQQLDNDRTVNPTVSAGDFTLALAGNHIELTFNGLYFDYTPGTKVTINHASTASLTLNTARQFKLDLVSSRNSATVSQSDGVYAAVIASGIGASIAAAAVGGLLSGIADAPVVAIQAGEAGADGAVDAGIQMADLAALPAGEEDGVGNIGEEADQAADAAVQGQPSAFSNCLNGCWALLRKWVPVVAMPATKAFIGSIPAIVNAIIKHEADKQGDIPTLDALGAQVLAPVSWPQQQPIAPGSSLSDVLVGGQLNGAFQVALNLTLATTPTT